LFSVVKGDFICKECQKLANELLADVEASQSYEEIAQALDAICDNVLESHPVLRKECKSIVGSLVDDLANLGVFLGKGYSGYGLCTMLNLCDSYCCLMPYRPEQVHISLTNDPTEMMISFVTGEPITPTVQWGEQNCHPAGGPPGEVVVMNDPQVPTCNFTYSTVGTSLTYHWGSWQGQIHRVLLTGLTPSTVYWYRVGDPNWDWSTHNFNFTTAPLLNSSSDPRQYKMIAFGDMGASDVSDVNIFQIQKLAQASEIGLILHAGDISYANGVQYVWDDYMRKVEFFSAYVPYMTAVGNHELFYNFTAFKDRFAMPGEQSLSNTNLFFSFDYGVAHIIAYSFEQYGGAAPEMHPGGVEYEWLLQDLKWAASSENRTERPWIIMYGHRPFYCTNTDSVACGPEAKYYRNLIEPMMYEYQVDLVITAHVHDYERTYPVYNDTLVSTSYDNPGAPTYVVVGTGGNREGNSGDGAFPANPPDWTVTNSDDIGFGFINLTYDSLNWQFFSSYFTQVVDEFTLTK